MGCQALLPPSNHQQVVIKAPRALLQNPLQLAFKFKFEREEAIANVHNLEVISDPPTWPKKVLSDPLVKGRICEEAAYEA